MTTYYVRKTGSDGAAGTSAGAAWLTIGKALGATGISSGDRVFIGAGTYREVVTVAMTSAVAETFVIGDVDGVKTGDAGEVIWTAYLTNDTTAPSGTVLLNLSLRDFLTFQKITFVQGSVSAISANADSTAIKFQDCQFLGNVTGSVLMTMTVGFGTVCNWVVERCTFRSIRSNAMTINLNTGSGADYDTNFVIRNCAFFAPAGVITINSLGVSAQEGGGVKIYNCLMLTSGSDIAVTTGDGRIGGSTFANPIRVYNSVIQGTLSAFESGAIVENYNHVMATTTHSNVTVGANSKTNTTYASLYDLGAMIFGAQTRSFGEPRVGSPYLGFGNDGTYTTTEDLRGNRRPAGGASATKGIGAYERGNTFAKETGTVRTGSNAISITGPGYQDFQLPVAASSTTVTVYVRWDATYAGTKPKMQVLNGTEAGVADATATATGSSGAWEQLSLNFTPTSAGIITIRLLSSDTNGGGKMFADDFAVT